MGSYGIGSMAEGESIICIFCGGTANIKEQNNQEVVSCPTCKRDTELVTYQDLFDLWLGDIRKE